MSKVARVGISALFLASLWLINPTPALANVTVVDTPGGACSNSVSSAQGVNITRVGNDCIIKFSDTTTTNGWVVPNNIANNSIRILIIGGGGGGNGRTDGTGWVGGGGGAGDYIESLTAKVTAGQTDSITVGNGGAWGSASTDPSNGGDSVFKDKYIITSIGGGGGGGTGNGPSGSYPNGFSGGSGGGGGTYSGTGGLKVGVGIGHDGGAANTSCCSSGGGGGAGTTGGTNPDANTGGSAGQGLSNAITGAALYYAGGGAGTGCTTAGVSNIATGGTPANTDATTGTGSGGGGGGANNRGCSFSTTRAGNGASGIIIIRYTLLSTPTLSISLSPNNASAIYRTNNSISVTLSGADGKVTFYASGKPIPGCRSIQSISSVATCTWKPAVHSLVSISATLASSAIITGSSVTKMVQVSARTGSR